MDDLRFKTLLEAYGADVERWPAAEREAGHRRLAAGGGQAQAVLKDAAALDALLRAPQSAQPSAALVGRIMEGAQGSARPGRGFAPGAIALPSFGVRARIAAACLMLVSLGAAAGWTTSVGVLGSAAGDALLATSYGEVADDLFAVEDL